MTDRPAETILALDLATTTGWCVGTPGGKPVYGSTRLGSPGATSGEVFAGFLAWLVDMIRVHDPRVVVYEAPLPPSHMRGKTNVNTARRLMGLPAIAEAVAYRMRVPVILEATVSDVRQHFIGKRTLPGAEGKLAVKLRCQMLGYSPPDDNASDALALWDYTCALRNPKIAAQLAMDQGFA
jgi:hypothetical protein